MRLLIMYRQRPYLLTEEGWRSASHTESQQIVFAADAITGQIFNNLTYFALLEGEETPLDAEAAVEQFVEQLTQ